MNANALRTWGIAVSVALMVGALAIAAQPPTPAHAQTSPTADTFEIAQAQSQPEPIAFLVRFTGSGPIARAQRLGAQQPAAAQRQLEIQLRRQRSFTGLCFDHFTVGAAEVVLRTCAAIVPSERTAVQQRWLTQLRGMRAVAYVDVNATATQNRAG